VVCSSPWCTVSGALIVSVGCGGHEKVLVVHWWCVNNSTCGLLDRRLAWTCGEESPTDANPTPLVDGIQRIYDVWVDEIQRI
jgi:hypothetical protein